MVPSTWESRRRVDGGGRLWSRGRHCQVIDLIKSRRKQRQRQLRRKTIKPRVSSFDQILKVEIGGGGIAVYKLHKGCGAEISEIAYIA